MELYKALKHIIQTDGKDVLLEPRLVNILDDFKAYEDAPSVKYILRAIIADGYMQKLLQAGAWNTTTKQLSQKFATTTGFMPETVELIFQSIAYGLNWIQIITPTKSQHIQKVNVHKSSWRSRMTDDEKNQYLLSLVEIEHETELTYGVKISNISFNVDHDKTYTIFCEMENIEQKTDCVYLHAAVYDLVGRIKGSITIDWRYTNDIKSKPVSTWINEVSADRTSKIRLWLE